MNIETVRAEALRKLGRNIVNFSKIEGLLKYLLALKEFEVVNGNVEKNFANNKHRLEMKTLGQLVQEFHKTVVVMNESEVESLAKDITSDLSIYLKVGYGTPDFLELQKHALSKIVTERNHLIHQYLAPLDTSCIGDYQKIIALLDEQHPNLLGQLKSLGIIVKETHGLYQMAIDFITLQASEKDRII